MDSAKACNAIEKTLGKNEKTSMLTFLLAETRKQEGVHIVTNTNNSEKTDAKRRRARQKDERTTGRQNRASKGHRKRPQPGFSASQSSAQPDILLPAICY